MRWCVRTFAFYGCDYYGVWLGLFLRVTSPWIPMLGADSKESEGALPSRCDASKVTVQWAASIRNSRAGYLWGGLVTVLKLGLGVC